MYVATYYYRRANPNSKNNLGLDKHKTIGNASANNFVHVLIIFSKKKADLQIQTFRLHQVYM